MTSSSLDDIPCDLSYLLGNLGGNRESARRLIGIYLDNYPKLQSSLTASFAARDLEALHNLIHDIRGGCVLFGAARCIRLVRQMEDQIRLHRFDVIQPTHWVQWEEEALALSAALEELAGELRQFLEAEFA